MSHVFCNSSRRLVLCKSLLLTSHVQLFTAAGKLRFCLPDMENGAKALTAMARRALAASSYTKNSASRSYCSYSPSSPASLAPNSKLFVAGLSWSVDEKSLLDAFSCYGEVTEVKILYDKHSGRSRGFGFVSFAKGDHAQSAKDAMDGKALLGRPLRISYALEKIRGAPIVVPHIRESRNNFN